MPQIKSQKKRVKTNNKRNLVVSAQKSALKTAIKKVVVAVEAGDSQAASVALHDACVKLDKAVSKGIKHRNYADRQKSRLSKLVNAMNA